MRRIRLAAAQISPTLGDLDRNLALHEKVAREAIARSIDLLVFPELSLTGYFLKDQVPSVALTEEAPALSLLADLSRQVAMVVGFVEEAAGHRFHNAAAYLEAGKVRHVHRKVYLPTYGIFDESRYLGAGDRMRAFDTALGRVAILICEDMWHPAMPGIAAWDGAELLVCSSASPGRGPGEAEPFRNARTWERMVQAYAGLYTCFLVYANRVGYEDGACFWGGSQVVGPDGEVLARAGYLEEALLEAELEPGALRRARIANPLLRDERLELTIGELHRLRRARTEPPWSP
jgi:predicted amidohydrolase